MRKKWDELSMSERMERNRISSNFRDDRARVLPVTMSQLIRWGACSEGRDDVKVAFADRKPLQVSVMDLMEHGFTGHAEWLYDEITARAEDENLYALKPEGKWRRPSKDSNITANNTWVSDDGVLFKCQLHKTVIVEYDRAKHSLILRNGGYRTMTTRNRINECLGYLGLQITVYADRGVDYITHPGAAWEGKDNRAEFIDGKRWTAFSFTGNEYKEGLTSEPVDGRRAIIEKVDTRKGDYSATDRHRYRVTLLQDGCGQFTAEFDGKEIKKKTRATSYREASEWSYYDSTGQTRVHQIAEAWLLSGLIPSPDFVAEVAVAA